MEKVKIGSFTFVTFLSKEDIEKEVQRLANEIKSDYKGKEPIFVIVMNGAFVFAADLLRHMDFVCETCFVSLKSYEDMLSTGNVKISFDQNFDIRNRDVIVIEDIIDSGNSMQELIPRLEAFSPQSISIATLLLKPDSYKKKYEIKYIGKKISNAFVIGYGLDFNNKGRNLDSIYQLEE